MQAFGNRFVFFVKKADLIHDHAQTTKQDIFKFPLCLFLDWPETDTKIYANFTIRNLGKAITFSSTNK